MTDDRLETFRRLAKALGWRLMDRMIPNDPWDIWVDLGDGRSCDLPAPDAPLHAHLEFTGRIIEAVEERRGLDSIWTIYGHDDSTHSVQFAVPTECESFTAHAHDLALAAALAALDALGQEEAR